MFGGSHARNFRKQDVIGYGRRDGLARIHIPNLDVFLLKPLAEITQPGTHICMLGQLLHHPHLYEAYPELRALPVTLTSSPKIAPADKAASYKATIGQAFLTYPPETDAAWIAEALIHEAQHGIQSIEGFSDGTTHSTQKLRIGRELVRRIDLRLATATLPKSRERLQARSIAFENVLFDRVKSADDKKAEMRLNLWAMRAYLRCPGEEEAFAAESMLLVYLGHLRHARPHHSQIVDRDYDWDELKVLLKFKINRTLIPLRSGITRAFNVFARTQKEPPLPAVCRINPARARSKAQPSQP